MARIRTRTSNQHVNSCPNAPTSTTSGWPRGCAAVKTGNTKDPDPAVASQKARTAARNALAAAIADAQYQSESTTIPLTEVMEDEITPNYFKRVAKGEVLPTNNCKTRSVLDTSVRLKSCALAASMSNPTGPANVVYWAVTRRTVQSSALPSNFLDVSSLLNACRLQAKAKLNSQGIDQLTTVSELHKTIAMVTGLKKNILKTAEHLVKSVKADLRKKKGKQPKKLRTPKAVMDALESKWLESRFGWRILYYDLQGIYDHLSRGEQSHKLIVGRHQESIRNTSSGPNGSTITRSAEVKVGYPGMLRMNIPGYANPLNTAWDIAPFSLVLDWFFDVQALILGLSKTPQNVKSLPGSSFEVITREIKVEAFAEPYHHYPVSLGEGPPGPDIVTYNRETTRRQAGDPTIQWPPFVGGPSGYQVLDFVSLMRPIYRALMS